MRANRTATTVPGTSPVRDASRDNAFDVLRLALAALVVLAHGLDLSAGHQPFLGRTEVGTLAVQGFFALSGYLVLESRARLTLPRFALHRALRLLPGFWVCLVLSALLVAPALALAAGNSWRTPFEVPGGSWDYLRANASLLVRQFGVAGAGAGGEVLNGSLWTLAYEAACYVVLGVVGVLSRRRWLLVAVPVCTAVLLVQTLGLVGGPRIFVGLLLVFCCGAFCRAHRDRLPTGPLATLTSALVLVVSCWLPDVRLVAALPLAHLVVVLGERSPWRPRLGADLSYGVYLWHWPVLLLVIAATGGAWPPALVVAAGGLLTLVPAAASWFLVERRALRWRHLGRRRDPGREGFDGSADSPVTLGRGSPSAASPR